MSRLLDLDATLARATSDQVRAAARRYLDRKQQVVGVLLPVAGTAAEPPAATPPAP